MQSVKLGVSIHAPVRMRQSSVVNTGGNLGFNSRTREDATKTSIKRSLCNLFQFTHP